MRRPKRTPRQATEAHDAVKGLLREMREVQRALARAGKYLRRLQRVPLSEVELTRARSRVLNRWNELRESFLLPLNEKRDEVALQAADRAAKRKATKT